jgi:hypothetical protein
MRLLSERRQPSGNSYKGKSNVKILSLLNIIESFIYTSLLVLTYLFGEIKMPKITLSIPDDVLKGFKEQFPEVNVAEVARRVIKEKVEELKRCERLKSKGEI